MTFLLERGQRESHSRPAEWTLEMTIKRACVRSIRALSVSRLSFVKEKKTRPSWARKTARILHVMQVQYVRASARACKLARPKTWLCTLLFDTAGSSSNPPLFLIDVLDLYYSILLICIILHKALYYKFFVLLHIRSKGNQTAITLELEQLLWQTASCNLCGKEKSGYESYYWKTGIIIFFNHI